eukprot:scaffold9774_cov143-Isochrysis_galbana.AAC.6
MKVSAPVWTVYFARLPPLSVCCAPLAAGLWLAGSWVACRGGGVACAGGPYAVAMWHMCMDVCGYKV